MPRPSFRPALAGPRLPAGAPLLVGAAVAAAGAPAVAQPATSLATTPSGAPQAVPHAAPPRLPQALRARPNDQTRPAGRRVGHVVRLTLEPRRARWTPVAGEPGLDRAVLAWAEADGTPMIPGPLVRGRVGDTLRLTIRNPLDRALRVVGLADPGSAAVHDTLRVAAGDSAVRTVVLTRAGSFWYDAVTRHPGDPAPRPGNPFPDKPHDADESLVGAFVVDPRDAPADVARRERVFVLHVAPRVPVAQLDTIAARRGLVPDVGLYVNGTAWPGTERLRYAVGDTVRWRLINAAFLPHPMHLHGFYFRVDARGDAWRDTVYAPGERRTAVTELLDGFTTARLTWTPDRLGNWLFHCHLQRHMAPLPVPASALPRVRALAAAFGSPALGSPASDTASRADVAPAARQAGAHGDGHGGDAHASADPTAAMHGHMAGLVFGVHVDAARPSAARPSAARGSGARVSAARAGDARSPGRPGRAGRPVRGVRPLDLWVTARPGGDGPPAVGYVLQEGPTPPAPDSVRRPGTPIVLARGEPVAITIHNARAVPVAVHWHGMELESRYDGVAGWSGGGRSVTPAVPPGGTFTARFTPPRAGTFIYHTHDEHGSDLAAGLYGAVVVREPGAPEARAAPTGEHLVVLGAGTVPRQPRQPPVPFVNADTGLTPLAFAPGANRLRVINIAENDLKRLRLLDAAGAPLRWRVVGKDGWTPPPRQRAVVRPADLLVSVGETYDLAVDADAAARATVLVVETRYYPGSPRVLVHEARVPVRVAAGGRP
jgi:FtsP/CotA-like multicopper oxidase with cupredoxin domain